MDGAEDPLATRLAVDLAGVRSAAFADAVLPTLAGVLSEALVAPRPNRLRLLDRPRPPLSPALGVDRLERGLLPAEPTEASDRLRWLALPLPRPPFAACRFTRFFCSSCWVIVRTSSMMRRFS